MKAHWLASLFVLTAPNIFAATILKGNSELSTTTFNFSVGPHGFYGSPLSMLVGADEAQTNNIFSVATYSSLAEQFIPLGVQTITLNNQPNQANPLMGQKIKFVSTHTATNGSSLHSVIIDKSPILATDRFIVISDFQLANATKPTETSVNLTQSAVPNDANGDTCGTIVGFTSGRAQGFGHNPSLLFGAVTAHDSSAFGTGNSGIALANYITTVGKNNNKTYSLAILDAQNGTGSNQAAAFNTSIDAVKIGSDITGFETDVFPVIDMQWSFYLQRLYIAVRVTSAAGNANGARAIIIGRFDNKKLVFDAFVPDDVILQSENDAIVGAQNGRSVSIYKLRILNTSTGLQYLIVNGGNNEIGESGILPVANKVFAIPLVNLHATGDENWLKNATHGTAAVKDQIPVTTYNDISYRFLQRRFTTAATTADQMTKQTDRAAVVGAGNLPLINSNDIVIKELFTGNDAVYAAIAAPYETDATAQEPGIFQSRAIFDQYGRITAWTPWQRVGGSDDLIYGASVETTQDIFWSMTGADSSHVNTIKKTVWGSDAGDGLLGGTTSNSSIGLVATLAQQFPPQYGGIQALNDFSNLTNAAGIPYSGLTGYTAMLTVGGQKLAFILTGDNSEADGTIKPYTGDFAAGLATSTTSSFPDGSGRVFVISGSTISDIGPLTTQTIFSNSTQSWIAIGGVNGVAILSDANGNGYSTTLPIGSTFKKVGDYSFVQKIIGDGQYLYILTNNTLERIVIDQSTFVSGKLNRTIIATTKVLGLNKYGSFSDVIIADKLAVLATSKGLFRIANNCSVKIGVPGWTPVPLGESVGPVFQLSAASSNTDYNTGLKNGGQLFALGAYQGFDEAQLYRLYLHEGDTLDDSCVQTIGDLFVKDKPSYFASFGQFQSTYTDDGSMRLSTLPGNNPRTIALNALPTMHIGDNSLKTENSTKIFQGTTARGSVERPARVSASGAWLVPGNFGLFVNE